MTQLIRFDKKIAEPTETALVLRPGLDFEEWQDVGKQLRRVEKAALWWLGDWLNYGERAYGEMYSQALEETEYDEGTLRNAKWVSSRVQLSLRSDKVPYKVHQEVASLEPEQQRALLAEAASEGLTVREVRTRVRNLKGGSARHTPLPPAGQFSVVLADPPWQYDFSPTDSRKIENQYPTLEVEQICALGERMPFADEAVLFLWATAPKLTEAFRVLDAWRFAYVTHAVWDKEVLGMGYWFRGQHELLLVATRGRFSPPDESTRVSSVIRSARAKHSEKPEAVYELIERAYPAHPKLELFARAHREGWQSWGNQLSAA